MEASTRKRLALRILRRTRVYTLAGTLLLGLSAVSRSQNNSDLRRGDNSDWWSEYQSPQSTGQIKSQKKEPNEKNLQILAIALKEGIFTQATATLGKTTTIARGDASTGRYQACYVSENDSNKIHLIFEQGELSYAFYLFEGGPNWDGSDLCTPSNKITKSLAFESGVRLGQTPKEVIAILGPPSKEPPNALLYAFYVRKKSTPQSLKNLRQKFPLLSGKDFHASYDYFDFNAAFQAKFKNNKLTYFSVSTSESY